ncbi:hypothetical protein JJC03_09795 [Flavobacterium oreochromis]|uniref:hypothetical protein n=1 Tax=Flavobacterium oreochromis TaxID=2906078 RepID=UPI001CE5637C|nr:hypothetical protein [Flavobacterium oreochromis]QYS85514.1 hypothetical protein JJC03_09795 [Flavobacterium oreochromis]
MLIEKIKYKSVNQIDISNSYTIIWSNNLILKNDKELVSGNINYVKRFKSSFLVEIDSTNDTFIYDLDNFSKIKTEKIGEFISKKVLLIGYWNKDYTNRLTKALDLIENKEIWESEKTFLNLSDSMIIFFFIKG